MKKLFVVWGTILFTVSILALPVMAAVVLQEKIISCGEPATIHGCGNKNPIASDPLKDGKVTVMDNGAVTVELKGAAVKATYHVYVGVWGGDIFFFRFTPTGSSSIGTVTTDKNGNYRGAIINGSGGKFVFPSGLAIIEPNFAFNNNGYTQFSTGFRILGEPAGEDEETDGVEEAVDAEEFVE
jgi:hypothetical protein